MRPFTRNLPGAAATLHVTVTHGEIETWKDLGKSAERGTPPARLVALVADLLGPNTPAHKSA